VEGEQQRAAALRMELERREEALRLAEEKHASMARIEARRMLLQARARVDEAIAGLERRVREGEALREASRKARRTVEDAARELEEPVPTRPLTAPAGDLSLEPGAHVRMVDSGARGTVVAVDGGRVVVNVGGMKLRVGRDWLAPDGDGEEERQDGGAAPRTAGSALWTHAGEAPSTEVDLRGQRADEAELALSRALDAATVADLRELRVIHGKGTGALRERVAVVLGRDARVERFRAGKPGEGGFGVTVARLA